ncbi:MFS transporter, PPP family, 3-phenylpropionic acid transporter [Hyphomicrobium facile]|uniref:MFS transporter, PPP family, 3-phenylpropionic acid transporter n=1 Tax=Hyphomicrobium facile TaxID=51670 RepID=A0A1I7NVA4_9HYPH|nr:MFS transporter, PPP family, 3-phenylpropionic acid transporter [Hyphomicrobium facile]
MGAGRDARWSFAVPVALFYAALFVVYGTNVPFMPVWLDWRGLSPAEISIIVATPLFLRLFVTPVIAMAADREWAHRRYLIILAWLTLGFVLALAASQSFGGILLFATLLMLCNSTIMPLIETIAVNGMRHRGLHYGRVRLWGSLSFVAASFAGGVVINAYGGGAGVWLIAFGCGLTVLAGHFLPAEDRPDAPAKPSVPLWQGEALRDLMRQRKFLVFLVAAGLAIASHAAFYTFGILIWNQQGLSAAWSGSLWAIGVFAEVLLFSVSGSVIQRFGAAQLIALGAAAAILRWLVMAFDPPLAVLLPLQILHGLTYGATHIGAIHFIHDTVDREKQGTAQALYATMSSGVAMGCSTLIAGWAYARGGSMSYLAMVAISIVSLAAGLWLVKSRKGTVFGAAKVETA